jgi:hypothetical protein
LGASGPFFCAAVRQFDVVIILLRFLKISNTIT